MEEVGVTEAEEATVEVGAVEEDEAAHEAVEALSSPRACLTISTTTVCTTREMGNASRYDTTEIGNGLEWLQFNLGAIICHQRCASWQGSTLDSEDQDVGSRRRRAWAQIGDPKRLVWDWLAGPN
jgi:hypothetical protein